MALIILACGVAGVLWWQKIGPFAEGGGAEETSSGAGPTMESDQPTPSSFSKNAPVFYPLNPLVVPVFGEKGVSATIQIHVKLEVVGKENRETVKHLRPKIADALLRDLYGFLPRLIKTKGRLDVTILKQRMKLIVDRTVGEGVIKDVLVQSISDHAK